MDLPVAIADARVGNLVQRANALLDEARSKVQKQLDRRAIDRAYEAVCAQPEYGRLEQAREALQKAAAALADQLALQEQDDVEVLQTLGKQLAIARKAAMDADRALDSSAAAVRYREVYGEKKRHKS